ncbi:3'(2'),5'-bisphosphate nucleotidase CysQ [Brevundimonas staleyi]|uniref:3'(2'),5'-bisphosphate nucleotidase CysQ n=1 Tax=Brevundimonas staleyi TaxID=74326 RepID=A0ABW0FMV9_9CAUL
MKDRLTRDIASGALHDHLADIAEEAAAVILPYWRAGGEVFAKADDSPVTLADREAEALILSRLTALYPEVQAVAEEQSEADGKPESVAERFWLIDPLDGTKGFVQGKESFTVNIALIEGDRPTVGVVSAPATSLTWRSAPGGGAQMRRYGDVWRSIQVRDRPDQGSALLSHSVTDEEAVRLASRYGCTQWQGTDSSLKFCLIAEGRFDAYPRTGPTMEWDTAAGQAVLEAAGGRVLGPDGQPLTYGKPGFLNGPFVAMGG